MSKKHRAKLADAIPILGELRQIRDALRNIETSLEATRSMEATRRYELLMETHPRYSDPLRLHRYGLQVNSQNYEDGMIREVLRRIGTTNRIFVEVGLGDGTENNTAFLLAQGWTGFWIDGSDSFVENVSGRTDLQGDCLRTSVSFVDRDNVAPLFKKLGVPAEPDVLSLDVDQNTYYIWEALHAYRPRLVVIEYNASIPPDLDWKAKYDAGRCWDYTHNFGAGLKSFELLGKKLGYHLVGCDIAGANAFFVRQDLTADKFSQPFTAEHHHEPPRYQIAPRRGHPRSILDRE